MTLARGGEGAPPPTSLRKSISTRSRGLWRDAFVFLVASAIRLIPFQQVYREDETVFFDGDAYYHLWRLWRRASDGVPLSQVDPYVNFPFGGEILWPPTLDWCLAQLARLGDWSQTTVEIVCAALPVAAGALTCVLAARIAHRAFSHVAGWLAGLLLAILPASFNYSQLGFFDHHAFAALLAAALLGGAMRRVDGQSTPSRFWWLGAGLLPALALSVWTGALLQIVVLQVCLIAWGIGADDALEARARVLQLARAHAIGALALMPISTREFELFGTFSPLAPTLFQPIYFACAAACLGALALLWRATSAGRTRVARWGSAAGVAALGGVLAFTSLPTLASTLFDAARWFSPDQRFLAVIHELRPLFASGDPVDLRRGLEAMTPLIAATPIALALAEWRVGRADRRILIVACVVFLALTLSQVRFINTSSVAYAIVWGGALDRSWTLAREAGTRSPRRSRWLRAVGVVLVMLLVLPSTVSYYVRVWTPPTGDARVATQDVYRDVARWLARRRPAPVDAGGDPLEGLLAPWSRAHEMRYYSGWPMHVDGFGPYVSPRNTEWARSFFRARDRDEAMALLARGKTRFVVSPVATPSEPIERPDVRIRLATLAGSGAMPTGGVRPPAAWIPAMNRLRIVREERRGRRRVRLFEVVPGADLVGRIEPDGVVEASLELVSNLGDVVVWRDRATADARGAFRLRVPYATTADPTSDFAARDGYSLRTRRGVTKVSVSADAVRTGGVVQTPAAWPQ